MENLHVNHIDGEYVLIDGHRRHEAISQLIAENAQCYDRHTNKYVYAKDIYSNIIVTVHNGLNASQCSAVLLKAIATKFLLVKMLTLVSIHEAGPTISWTSGLVTNAGYNPGNVSDQRIDKTLLVDMPGEIDPAKRNKMLKDLAVYTIEECYRIAGPHQYIYNFWQPWLKNYNGEMSLSWGRVFYFYMWVDQALKQNTMGMR
jgi:hypothetical protein